MRTVKITVGIPASGKTTWARAQAKSAGNTVITSRDDIRLAHGLASGENENLVTRIQRQQIEVALLDGMDVIVADTNINPRFRNALVKFCHEHRADVYIKVFRISQDEAMMRDRHRANTVGSTVIAKFVDDLSKQDIVDEYLPFRKFRAYSHPEDGRTPAIVVDIDGTLAHANNRSPYDESRVGEDVFDDAVGAAVRGMAEHTKADILVVSGRTDKCRGLTERWLSDNNFEYTRLIMRKAGDSRPDYVVKNEIYDEHIIPDYTVLAAFDDRDQVVRHVRARGITVFQVAPGRF